MKIEQPASLNRYVDASIPLTLEKRLDWLRLTFPVLVVTAFIFCETILLSAWMDDVPLGNRIHLVLVAPLLIFGLLFLSIELQMQCLHRAKRLLHIKDKKIQVSHEKSGVIRFENISAWRFESLPTANPLHRFSIQYTRERKGGIARIWSMVLTSDQVDAMRAAIDNLRISGKVLAPIFEGSQAAPVKLRNGRISGLWSLALAFYLFMHGLPLLGVGLLSSDSSENRPSHDNRPRQNLSDAITSLSNNFWFTPQEWRNGYILIGGGLVSISLVLYVSALRTLKREKSVEEPITEERSLRSSG